ncbi:DUF4184 family protein [Adhaeribacter swui]|uniref:DUF4184 family protein n=1 Tax=Adhaeribacter swui TaxID=2086471 RepID=A0A7G7G9M9_9BACT|nr:DUF4184 family protein [Adhaeribacter swui]QNF33863.1 DUF4184 family protein [Adhaeribacter swui]
MPFTFAHPAIVLAGAYLPKYRVSLTGLVAGSLAPDFEYFFRAQVLSVYSHTLPGIFWFNLPVALALSLAYHVIIKKAMLENLPGYFKARLLKFKNLDWLNYFQKRYGVVLFSILIGTASHILWDSFTHHHGFFVENFKILSQAVSINKSNIPVYKLLQHGSSLLGLLLILAVISNLSAEKVSKNKNFLIYWLVVVAFTVLLVSLQFIMGLELNQYGNVVVTFISAAMLSIILASLVSNQTSNK